MASATFDTLHAAKTLAQAGFAPPQAEAITDTIRAAFTDSVATKADIAELRADMAALRTELKGDIAELRTELKGDMAGLRTDMAGEPTWPASEPRYGLWNCGWLNASKPSTSICGSARSA